MVDEGRDRTGIMRERERERERERDRDRETERESKIGARGMKGETERV